MIGGRKICSHLEYIYKCKQITFIVISLYFILNEVWIQINYSISYLKYVFKQKENSTWVDCICSHLRVLKISDIFVAYFTTLYWLQVYLTDGTGSTEMVFGEMSPRIYIKLIVWHFLTDRENIGENPTMHPALYRWDCATHEVNVQRSTLVELRKPLIENFDRIFSFTN